MSRRLRHRGSSATVASGANAVWEWSNDSNGYTSYDQQTTAILEAAFTGGQTKIELTHSFFGSQGGYSIDFTKMTQVKKATGFERTIRRTGSTPAGASAAAAAAPAKSKKRRAQTMTPAATSANMNNPAPTNILWEWEDDTGFVTYDSQTCAILEAAHSAGQLQLDLTHGYFGSQGGYSIDLSQMTQTKKKSGYCRQIRRVDPTASSSSAAIPAPVKRPKAVSNTPAPAPIAPVAPVAPVSSQPTPVASTSSPSTSSTPTTPATPGGPIWEYSSTIASTEDDDDDEEPAETWTAFDRITTRLIEGAIATGRSTTTLNHGAFVAKGGCYLDFGAMEMRETKTNNTVKIRRNPPLSIQIKSPKLDHSGGSNATAQPTAATPETKASKKKGAKKAEGTLSPEETALKKLTNWKEVAAKEIEEKDNCPVCLCALKEDGVVPDGSQSVVRLGKCTGHFFHRGCVLLCYQHSKNQYVRCPICTTIYGVLVGTQPKGTMTSSKSSTSLPGYPKCGMITVNYNFPSGTQGPEHPHPGRHYSGTSRTGYLPDNAEGNEVLRLLKIAFERKLVFRIGQSVTTGADDQVVWNGIHHKTSTSGGASNYGYPDETYLERVKEELAQKGVE